MAAREKVRNRLEAIPTLLKVLSYFMDVKVHNPKVIGIFLDIFPLVPMINAMRQGLKP
jgi:hypothetical protein